MSNESLEDAVRDETKITQEDGTQAVLPENHLPFAESEHGLLLFAASNGEVHIHLLTPAGDIECLAVGTVDHSNQWLQMLHATRNVAMDQRD